MLVFFSRKVYEISAGKLIWTESLSLLVVKSSNSGETFSTYLVVSDY